ncbi:MAG: DNA alkylation repair protein [FCB group bacterium]|nr:DNA alkylation repair protein [FCB group bacterium]
MDSQAAYPLTLFSELQADLSAVANEERARQQQSYMKSLMPYWGIASSERKKIALKVFKKFPPSDNDMYRRIVQTIFDRAQYREEWYCAVDFAVKYKKYISTKNVDLYLYLIRQAQWWDVVDGVAVWLVGAALKGETDLSHFLKDWIRDQNLWIRRTALLTQLQYKRDTDFALLRKLILQVMHEKEFFIRKAIGWVLRQYSYTDAEAVIRFVSAHEDQLSKLSVTEALKALKRRGYFVSTP